MKIRRISDGKIFEVRKYVNGFGEESVWCDDWYGHHMIHRDCEFVDTYTAEDMEAFAEWCAENYLEFYNENRVWKKTESSLYHFTTSQLRELWEEGRREK